MRYRQVIGTIAIVTLAVTSVLCGCKSSFAASTSAAAAEGCHGGHQSKSSDSSSHEHQQNCQHCKHAQFLESKDAGKSAAAPVLQPLAWASSNFLVAVPPMVFVTSRQRMPCSRAAPPPLHLLNQVFLI
jgi:hypothetical protein